MKPKINFRLIPKISYTNFRNDFPNMGATAFSKWFDITRCWSGKLIYVCILHHQLSFDFRKDWLSDMCPL